MPIVMQEHLIQKILRPLSLLAEKIPCAAREATFSISLFFIILMEFAVKGGFYTGRYLLIFAAGCCLLGIMIFAGLTPEISPARFSPALTACWLGCAVFLTATGLLVESDSLSIAIPYLIIFPVFYLVWSSRGYDRLFPLVVRGVLFSFLFFAIVSVFFYPITDINYASFFINRNGTGIYLLCVFVCVLCYIFTQECYSLRTFAADAVIGFASATIYYTNCRTAIGSAVICFLSVSILQLLTHKKELRRVLLVQLLPIVIAVILLVPSAIYLYHGGYSLSSGIQSALAPPPPDVSDSPDSSAPPITPSGSDVLDTMKEYNSRRFFTEGIIMDNPENLNPTEKELDNITSGRVTQWLIYLREVGFLGHSSDTVLFDSAGKEVSMSSHFTIIQFAYQYGALAGVFFLLLNILAGLSSIRFAVLRKDIKYRLAPLAVAVAFGATSVMEAISNPLDGLSLLYYLSLTSLIAVPRTKKEFKNE